MTDEGFIQYIEAQCELCYRDIDKWERMKKEGRNHYEKAVWENAKRNAKEGREWLAWAKIEIAGIKM